MRKHWKKIEEFEGYYVSNQGEVKSFRQDKINGRLMKCGLDPDGYVRTALCHPTSGKRINFRIHRLVAQHFLDDWDPNLSVDHIDEDKQNNHENNLRMCTLSQNNIFYHQNRKYKSRYTGVIWKKQYSKWYAKICVNRKSYVFGYYDTEEEAYKIRRHAEKFGIEEAKLEHKRRKKDEA